MSSKTIVGTNTSSNDPKMLDSRVFIGNLPSEKVTRVTIENMFAEFGKILGVSLHKSYGFVQFEKEEEAKKAVEATHGKMLEGKSLDVNLAAKRRKEAEEKAKRVVRGVRGGDSGHRDDHRERRSRSKERYRRRSRSPPPFDDYRGRYRMPPPPFRDPYFDFPPPRDMFYPPPPPPLDDPYDRFPPPPPRGRDPFDPLDRMLPPPRRERDLLPPLPRDRDLRDRELRDRDMGMRDREMGIRDREIGMRDREMGMRDRDLRERDFRDRDFRDRELRDRDMRFDEPRGGPRSFSPPPAPPPPRRDPPPPKGDRMTDMEIIVVNKQQKEYADMICGRVKFFGLVVEMVNLNHAVSLADALDAAANRGLLYAIIVTSQHELHSSVTLTILHGRNPQEHKNMPLEDAISLVDRDYQRYMLSVREGRIPPRRPKSEVSSLLSQVASGGQVSADQLQHVIDVLQKQKQQTNEPTSSRVASQAQIQLPPKDDIQRQQADLQAKILSLLGTSAVVSSSGSQPSPRTGPRSGGLRSSFGEAQNGRNGGPGLLGPGPGPTGYGGRGADSGGRGYGQGGYSF